MIRSPLVLPELLCRIHSPNRDAIAKEISIASAATIGLPPHLRFVFMCFTNRSGSAYLGELLQSTGLFEQALESLNADAILTCCREHGMRSIQEYFAHIVRRDASSDHYIVKAAPEQLRLLAEAGILGQISTKAEFLLITRVDKLGQAISRAIAAQNLRWRWDSPSQFPDDKLQYSAERIAQNVYDIGILNQSFEEFFALNGIIPINVEYERLVSQPQQELEEIARTLRLAGLAINADKMRIRRQANLINQSWRSRFLLETEPPLRTTPVSEPALHIPPLGRPPEVTVSTVHAVEADVLAHIRNIGDVTGPCGTWIGQPGSGLWIEGFNIKLRNGMPPGAIKYQAIHDFGRVSPWVDGGDYCGSRGISVPLRGFCIRTNDASAGMLHCEYSAWFQDGETVGPVPAGQPCQSARNAPLESLQILLSRR
jgi:LPS sulfotransferase NodH